MALKTGAILAPSGRTGSRPSTPGENFFSEHEPGSSSRETTTSLSLGSTGVLSAKLVAYRRHEQMRCTCPHALADKIDGTN